MNILYIKRPQGNAIAHPLCIIGINHCCMSVCCNS